MDRLLKAFPIIQNRFKDYKGGLTSKDTARTSKGFNQPTSEFKPPKDLNQPSSDFKTPKDLNQPSSAFELPKDMSNSGLQDVKVRVPARTPNTAGIIDKIPATSADNAGSSAFKFLSRLFRREIGEQSFIGNDATHLFSVI